MILINSRGVLREKLHDFKALVVETCKLMEKPILFVLVSKEKQEQVKK